MRDRMPQGARGEVQALRNAAKAGVPVGQCHATARVSGQRCKNPAIMGGTVCPYHGGNAPQVREAARRRLLEMVPDAVEAMAGLAGIVDGVWGAEDEKVRQRALADVLDRAGLRPADQVVLTEQALPNEALDAAIANAMRARGMIESQTDISDAEIVETPDAPTQ